jgi:hypothetical protein
MGDKKKEKSHIIVERGNQKKKRGRDGNNGWFTEKNRDINFSYLIPSMTTSRLG